MKKKTGYKALWIITALLGVSTSVFALEPGIADNKHMGVASCATSVCHGKLAPQTDRHVALNEYRIWQQEDRHAQAYRTLELAESKRIAANLGLPNATAAKICLDCHADNVPADKRGPKFQISDGVGCEGCHGGSEKWLESHTAETAAHQENVARGMYPTEQPLKRAQVCLGCHLGTKDQFATHAIMGAGHPRLSFEMEAYTNNQPAHFVVDADYMKRKGKIEGMNLWVTGQIENTRRYLWLLQTSMFQAGSMGGSMFPELAFYDCQSCHHSMDKLRWTAARAGEGVKPGSLRLQTQNLIVLQALVETFEPASAARLADLTNNLVRAGQRDRAAVDGAAKLLQGFLSPLEALARKEYSSADVIKMRKTLARFATTEKAGDYAAAEQIVLGLESLSYTIGDRNSKKAALDALYGAVKNDGTFSPAQFAAAAANAQKSF